MPDKVITSLRSKLVRYWHSLIHPVEAGWIKCDVCGEWGMRNPNYKYVDTFVHHSSKGVAYMHSIHIVQQHMGTLRERQANLNEGFKGIYGTNYKKLLILLISRNEV